MSDFDSTGGDIDVFELLALFRQNVVVKDRKYRLSTYKQVFVGSEAVQWLVASGNAQNRQDAVRLGMLIQDAGMIEHALREHDFKDEYKFYRFIEDTDRGAVPMKGNRAVSWGDFVAPAMDGKAANLMPKLPSKDSSDFGPQVNGAAHVASMVSPMDEYNVKLLDNVHPPEWIDPEFDGVYNMVILGAGAGGLVSAASAAGAGAKVALIEAHLLGGDCLNVGCVPSKALLHAANLAHTVRNSEALADSGITISGEIKIDFAQTMRRMRAIRADISPNDSAQRFTKKLGVDVYFGFGKFKSERTVEVNGKILEFKKAVIATGGTANIPRIDGLADLDAENRAEGDDKPCVVTNDTFFNMTVQPRTLGVIGTGVVGMELGQAMQRLGTQVTMFGRSGSVLSKEDADLAETVKAQLASDGVRFSLNVAEYKSAKKTGTIAPNGYPELMLTTVEDGEVHEYRFDAILVAAGRRPNVTGMDLEKAKVEYDQKVGLKVNDQLNTTNPRIYGVGDCCSAFKFTHAADFMARMVVRNALFLGTNKMSNLLIPYATFTTPEIAHVGLYESDLRDRKIQFKTFEKHFADNDRAICDGTTTGMVRIHIDAKSDRILGASILGDGAGNMISQITLAMQSGTGLGKLASVIFPYPTMAEAIRQTGDLYNKTKLTTTVRGLLRSVINLQR